MYIQQLSIKNFKSIKDLELSNFKKINLFIGRPNVGKSNIVEAISLFSLPYLKFYNTKKITYFTRLENESELFFEGNITKPIEIHTNNNYCQLHYKEGEGLTLNLNDSIFKIDEKFLINKKEKRFEDIHSIAETDIKRYIFTNTKFPSKQARYLIPPFGGNILDIIEKLPSLKKMLIELFETYHLHLVFDKASQSLKIMKSNISNKEIFLLPYNSIADTLRRVIFFKTAVVSNQNSVLLFEEPEAHSFPPYIVHITQEIINSKSNQFFITTHSPFIVNDFLENAMNDLAIFVVDYKDNQTVVKSLSESELSEVYQYGIDLFTNIETFL
jgi:AAA15 family ATPase/GTPase